VVNLRRAVWACLAIGQVTVLLTGCDLTTLNEQKPRVPDPFDTVQNTDLSPRYPQPVAQESGAAAQTPGSSYYGQEVSSDATGPASGEPGAQPTATGDSYELNFENAAVSTVAKVILGDILKVGYTIDPRVQGTVTIASGRPVPKNELVMVLENALRMSNVVLLPEAGGGYRLIPSGDAQGAGGVLSQGSNTEAGYGISVVPLRYTSAQTILKLLDSFAIKPGMARADTGHNMILVQGTTSERKSAVETILSFDVDWMRGQSVGIYPLESVAPEEMIKELEKIMENGDGGLDQSLVTLQPVARLNAVLVVARKPNLLRQAALWIKRLDKSDNAGTAVHVYRLRYGDARQITRVLSDLFGSRSQGLNSPVNQLAPGAGATTATSTGNGIGFPGSTGTQGGLAGGASGAGGLGALSGTTGGTGTGSAGLQLGNLGSGFGNSQNLANGTNPGSANISPGAFGNQNNGGETSVVLPGMRIAADVTNNSLVIYANQENYRLIVRAVAQLDRPQLQVAIHATIAEVTLNNDLQFGVEYYLQNSAGSSAGFNSLIGVGASTSNNTSSSGLSSTGTSSSGGIISTPSVSQALSAVLPGGNLILGPQSNPRIVINALRAITDVKVLSSPSVVVLDNQPATLLVGDQVPVETASANVLAATTANSSTVVNSINYINTGVILHVIPRVNANGTVNLDVEQEVSDVLSETAQTLTPTVSQRQIKSAIAVSSGQTVLLGGLISESQSRTRSGIPVLEELPGPIGNLFSTNGRSTSRDEVIIFIQPEIIRNGVDAAKVAEELRAKMRGSANSAFHPGPSLYGDPRFAQ
jgi:general secretion pathway protein D